MLRTSYPITAFTHFNQMANENVNKFVYAKIRSIKPLRSDRTFKKRNAIIKGIRYKTIQYSLRFGAIRAPS